MFACCECCVSCGRIYNLSVGVVISAWCVLFLAVRLILSSDTPAFVNLKILNSFLCVYRRERKPITEIPL
jgi:hypothetical protein